MTLASRLSSCPTKRFVWAAIFLFLAGWAADAVTGPLWVHFGVHAHALEFLGGGLAWIGYGMLWALLPVSAFRPEARFYLKGDCLLRAKRFGLVLAMLIILHIAMAINFALAWG